MIKFLSFSGYVTEISDFMVTLNGEDSGCYKLISVNNVNKGSNSFIHFVVSPTTYFVDHIIVSEGDWITGYYDGNAPVPLIYPPQYQALVVVKESPYQNVKVDHFDQNLLSSDGRLKLNLSSFTQRLLTNGQPFTKNLANRNLIVLYGPVTKSIPAQTTPYKIIVLC
ncbi:hypothetical protein [Pueribacillus sp. YX66]|uniref:hypothetical protein n=1 Tax=Pueribacillus sp. YX66 TaxID=3229242 RepID=UPI00358CE2EB